MVQVLGTPARGVGQVDPAGRQRLAPRTEVLEHGAVEHSVVTLARLGPQVVPSSHKVVPRSAAKASHLHPALTHNPPTSRT